MTRSIPVILAPEVILATLMFTGTVWPRLPEALTMLTAIGEAAKLAVTVLLAFIVIVAGLVLPVRSPDQELKEYPVLAAAVSVTTVPGS